MNVERIEVVEDSLYASNASEIAIMLFKFSVSVLDAEVEANYRFSFNILHPEPVLDDDELEFELLSLDLIVFPRSISV